MDAARTPPENAIYARWLSVGVGVGFAALVISFVVYLTGLVPPGIAPQKLPQYWSLPVAEYVALTGAPTGWNWVFRLGEGDLLNFVGVAVLAMTSVICQLRVLPHFARTGQRSLAIIAAAQVVLLAAAASGLLFTVH
jgi:hypothetical protein